MLDQRSRYSCLFPIAIALLFAAGCGVVEPAINFATFEGAPRQAITAGRRIAPDPELFLRQTLLRCQALQAYEVDFYKQERLGLLVKQLRAEEHMRVKFRAEPFSVRMVMLNEDHDFAETLYVEGQNGNKLRCRWRRALLGGEPPVNDYPAQFAVQFGKTINPITDFGVARMMERALDALDQAAIAKTPAEITYVGVTRLEKGNSAVHHIRVQYPDNAALPGLRVDLLFHADSLLPAASYVRPGGDVLEGRYIYTEFDVDVDFDDEDFRFSDDP